MRSRQQSPGATFRSRVRLSALTFSSASRIPKNSRRRRTDARHLAQEEPPSLSPLYAILQKYPRRPLFPTPEQYLERFAEQMPPPKACQASAGSDLIGCHSAVLDADGRLYTWGVGAAAGHASLKPVLLPRCETSERHGCSTDCFILAVWLSRETRRRRASHFLLRTMERNLKRSHTYL